MLGRYSYYLFAALLVVSCQTHVSAASRVLAAAKEKPKSKPNPKSKPGPGSKPKPGPGGSNDGTSFCEENFNRTDTELDYPVLCGKNSICLPTTESVVAAVGYFDVSAAMESTAVLDIRCMSQGLGSENVCDNSYSNADCNEGYVCVASAAPLCLESCKAGCYDTSAQGSSPEISDSNDSSEPIVTERTFETFYVVNAGIGAVAMVFLGRKVWQSNHDQPAFFRAESGHELVSMEEEQPESF